MPIAECRDSSYRSTNENDLSTSCLYKKGVSHNYAENLCLNCSGYSLFQIRKYLFHSNYSVRKFALAKVSLTYDIDTRLCNAKFELTEALTNVCRLKVCY